MQRARTQSGWQCASWSILRREHEGVQCIGHVFCTPTLHDFHGEAKFIGGSAKRLCVLVAGALKHRQTHTDHGAASMPFPPISPTPGRGCEQGFDTSISKTAETTTHHAHRRLLPRSRAGSHERCLPPSDGHARDDGPWCGFRKVMANLNSGLRYAFDLSPSQPEMKTQSWTGEDGYRVVVVSGSGTAAMEMVIANQFRNNDLVLVPTNGKFGERVADICRQFCNVKQLQYEWGRSFDLYELEQQLEQGLLRSAADLPQRNEQRHHAGRRSHRRNVRATRRFLHFGRHHLGGRHARPSRQMESRGRGHGSPEMYGRPSGIAAIAVNEHCVERIKAIHQQGDANPRYYLDMISALKKGDDDQTPWTPAINLAMGWGAALNDLKTETNEARWARCETMAKGVRGLFTDLGFTLLADSGQRSNTVTAILYPEGVDDAWRTALKDKYDTQVIGAQDHLKGKMFRVGSMGETPVEEMIEGCKRMIACFRDFGVELNDVDVESYFG